MFIQTRPRPWARPEETGDPGPLGDLPADVHGILHAKGVLTDGEEPRVTRGRGHT